MHELSHNKHLDPSLEATPLFGAEVDVAPGEVMSLGVISEGHEAGRQAEEARPHHVLARGRVSRHGRVPRGVRRLPALRGLQQQGSVLDGKQPPSLDHWFGTDYIGRDIFSRFVYGARMSLAIGVTSLVFGLTIGGFFGLMAGYYRRRTDTLISTVMDILLAFPALVLALVLVTFGSARGGDRHFEIGPISSR